MKAKDASLIAKIVASTILVVAHVLMWVGMLQGADSKSILTCSLGILCIFGTIDINLMLEKFRRTGE